MCPFPRRAEGSDAWPDRWVIGLGGGSGEEGSGKLARSSERVLSLCFVLRRSGPSLELMSESSGREELLVACLCEDLRSMMAASSIASSMAADISGGGCSSAAVASDSPDGLGTSELAVSAVVPREPVAWSRQLELRGSGCFKPLPEQAAADSPAVLCGADRAVPSLTAASPLGRPWFRSLPEPKARHADGGPPATEACLCEADAWQTTLLGSADSLLEVGTSLKGVAAKLCALLV